MASEADAICKGQNMEEKFFPGSICIKYFFLVSSLEKYNYAIFVNKFQT
jgi:hypothetical protein